MEIKTKSNIEVLPLKEDPKRDKEYELMVFLGIAHSLLVNLEGYMTDFELRRFWFIDDKIKRMMENVD